MTVSDAHGNTTAETDARIVTADHSTDWRAHAACRGLDPDLFFPDRGESVREAKAVCAECTVSVECLDYALSIKERFGIWGGTSERTRRQMRSPAGTRRHVMDVAFDVILASTGDRPCKQSAGCYGRGCRNEACKEANRVQQRTYKARYDERKRQETAATPPPARKTARHRCAYAGCDEWTTELFCSPECEAEAEVLAQLALRRAS